MSGHILTSKIISNSGAEGPMTEHVTILKLTFLSKLDLHSTTWNIEHELNPNTKAATKIILMDGTIACTK